MLAASHLAQPKGTGICHMGRSIGERLTVLAMKAAQKENSHSSPSKGGCESLWLWATHMQSLAHRNSWLIALSSLPLLSKCRRLNTLLPDLDSALIPESQPGEAQYSTAGKKINSNNTKMQPFLVPLVKMNAFNLSSASKMSVIFSGWNEWYLNTIAESQFLEGFSTYQTANRMINFGYTQHYRTQITG